jgi:hypothetical protein
LPAEQIASLWGETKTGFQNFDCSDVSGVAKSVFGINHVKNLQVGSKTGRV